MSEETTRRLAAIIIQTAVSDWNLLKKQEVDYIHYDKEQYDISKQELLQFFNSTWLDCLTDILELDADKILEKLFYDSDDDNGAGSSIRSG